MIGPTEHARSTFPSTKQALVILVAAGCGSTKSQHAAPPATGPVWTSPAEPSPPGTGHRWSPADEWQLRDSAR